MIPAPFENYYNLLKLMNLLNLINLLSQMFCLIMVYNVYRQCVAITLILYEFWRKCFLLCLLLLVLKICQCSIRCILPCALLYTRGYCILSNYIQYILYECSVNIAPMWFYPCNKYFCFLTFSCQVFRVVFYNELTENLSVIYNGFFSKL